MLQFFFSVEENSLLRRRLLYSLAHGHTGAARRAASDWVRSEYLQNIPSARVYDVADETPLQYAPVLSSSLGHNVYLKREDLQPVFSLARARCIQLHSKSN